MRVAAAGSAFAKITAREGQSRSIRIVRLDIAGLANEAAVLASGHDFYSSPRLSPDGRWLAFLAWDHPNMPWMGTGLYVLQLNAAGMPAQSRC